MKRIGFLFDKIIDIENIKMAHKMARMDKTFYREVKMVDKDIDYYAKQIQEMLINKTYVVSEYRKQIINDKGKERTLMKLQYYPDRIIQWAIMLQLEPIFIKTFCTHTCASIPNRGIDRAWTLVRKYMKDQKGTKYCLKLDVRKFYDNIDHTILKQKLRHKIKDNDLLELLDTIIDSYDGEKGVPIGSYLSQYFANFYLSDLDHYIKEDLSVKYVVRYMDDVVIFADNKERLHEILDSIKIFLANEKLELKNNYQIFPTGVRGVDFIGFRFFYHFVLLRKKTVKRLKKLCLSIKYIEFEDFCAINSYNGWLQMCNSYHLREKYILPLRDKIFAYYFSILTHDKIASFNRYTRKFNIKCGIKAFS